MSKPFLTRLQLMEIVNLHKKEIIEILDGGETDNYGQVVIYTGYEYNDDRELIELRWNDDDDDDDKEGV